MNLQLLAQPLDSLFFPSEMFVAQKKGNLNDIAVIDHCAVLKLTYREGFVT